MRYRYPHDDVRELPGSVSDSAKYKFRLWPLAAPLDALVILKACDGFDYQACETDDYEQSVACCIVNAIRGYAIRRLPGYSASPGWELTRPVKA